MRVGDKIKMTGERMRYTVQACDDRFAIMTKPFNAQHTYLYSIIDLEMGVRGPCNLIFGLCDDVDNPDDAAVVLEKLQSGEIGVSRRNFKELTTEEIIQMTGLAPIKFRKDADTVSTDDPYYDLFDGGYIDPDDLLEPESAARVNEALDTIREFLNTGEAQDRIVSR